MAVGAVKRLVALEQGLDLVRTGGDLREAHGGIAQDVGREHGLLAGLPAVDLDAEDLLAVETDVADLESRLLALVRREEQEDAAVERAGDVVRAAVGDDEPRRGGRAAREAQKSDDRQRGQSEKRPRAQKRHRMLLLFFAESIQGTGPAEIGIPRGTRVARVRGIISPCRRF